MLSHSAVKKCCMQITIYSTKTCVYCHALSEWLDEQGMRYTYKQIDTDPEGMDEFMRVNDGVISVPLTILKNDAGVETKVSGFDKARLKEVLGL